MPRERQRVAATILDQLVTLEQAAINEAGEQLRDRRAGHAGAPRELRARYPFRGDRTERQELCNRQRRVVAGEQPLNPAADERRDSDERLGSLRLGAARRRH